MEHPAAYRGVAHNQATASENRIHSDEVARQYGFRGGLVPGVTVYAYLVEPAVRAWGRAWLERGRSRVVLRRPLYDGAGYAVEPILEPGGASYQATVRDAEGVACAEGGASLPAEPPASRPERRGDPPVPPADERPPATREVLEALRENGLGALHLEWRGSGPMDRYQKSLEDMPDLVRPDRGGLAHPAFTLGLANGVLAGNVRLGPWIHVESEVEHHGVLPLEGRAVVEGRVRDLFSRGGHEFVDLDVEVYDEGDRPLQRIFHRAIYVLRPAAG